MKEKRSSAIANMIAEFDQSAIPAPPSTESLGFENFMRLFMILTIKTVSPQTIPNIARLRNAISGKTEIISLIS